VNSRQEVISSHILPEPFISKCSAFGNLIICFDWWERQLLPVRGREDIPLVKFTSSLNPNFVFMQVVGDSS
jgi:hypothetical protein